MFDEVGGNRCVEKEESKVFLDLELNWAEITRQRAEANVAAQNRMLQISLARYMPYRES